MARKIETRKRALGGSEAMLDGAAVSLLVLGIVLAPTLAGMFFFLGGAFRLHGVIPASLILVMTLVAFYLFRGLADIIRVLKQSAGIPYSGRIAAGPQRSEFKCSDCSAVLRSGLKCDSCGAEIEYD